jgi:hypothetical protein
LCFPLWAFARSGLVELVFFSLSRSVLPHAG